MTDDDITKAAKEAAALICKLGRGQADDSISIALLAVIDAGRRCGVSDSVVRDMMLDMYRAGLSPRKVDA